MPAPHGREADTHVAVAQAALAHVNATADAHPRPECHRQRGFRPRMKRTLFAEFLRRSRPAFDGVVEITF